MLHNYFSFLPSKIFCYKASFTEDSSNEYTSMILLKGIAVSGRPIIAIGLRRALRHCVEGRPLKIFVSSSTSSSFSTSSTSSSSSNQTTRTTERQDYILSSLQNDLSVETEFSINPYELDRHGRGESYHPTRQPDIIITPSSVNDVSTILKFANENRIPIIPFGAGTSVEGHLCALHGGISLDMTKFQDIVLPGEEEEKTTTTTKMMMMRMIMLVYQIQLLNVVQV